MGTFLFYAASTTAYLLLMFNAISTIWFDGTEVKDYTAPLVWAVLAVAGAIKERKSA